MLLLPENLCSLEKIAAIEIIPDEVNSLIPAKPDVIKIVLRYCVNVLADTKEKNEKLSRMWIKGYSRQIPDIPNVDLRR